MLLVRCMLSFVDCMGDVSGSMQHDGRKMNSNVGKVSVQSCVCCCWCPVGSRGDGAHHHKATDHIMAWCRVVTQVDACNKSAHDALLHYHLLSKQMTMHDQSTHQSTLLSIQSTRTIWRCIGRKFDECMIVGPEPGPPLCRSAISMLIPEYDCCCIALKCDPRLQP